MGNANSAPPPPPPILVGSEGQSQGFIGQVPLKPRSDAT